jgi:hypothetical protein
VGPIPGIPMAKCITQRKSPQFKILSRDTWWVPIGYHEETIDTRWVPLGITWKIKIKLQFWHCVKPLARGYYLNWCEHSFSKMPNGFLHFIKHFYKYTINLVGSYFMDQLMMLGSMGHWGSALKCFGLSQNPLKKCLKRY